MKWNLIEYQTFTGKFNMDFDLQLVKNCSSQESFLRFYGWNPHCVSIGANQSYEDINKSLAEINNIDIVKRPTGGRAILHSEELTYSVIIPNNKNVSGRFIYEQISEAIVLGLQNFDSGLSQVMLENIQPNFSDLLNEPSGSLCFASTAKSEIKFNGKKLVGSAQRKIGNKILQHGSILIGSNHKNIVDYLNIAEQNKSKLKNEMKDKTTEISTILNRDIDIIELQQNIILGFENIFKTEFAKTEPILLPI
ncbi:MAG: lipoate--protein ligase family protein [Ignavibacteriae bacterium]|nr:lipoate--protein ligase family protein [Ignavibacteriota bacterium]